MQQVNRIRPTVRSIALPGTLDSGALRRRRLRWPVLWCCALALTTSCGTEDNGDQVTAETGAQVLEAVEVAEAVEQARLPTNLYRATDDRHIWLSDQEHFATYDAAAETWTTSRLPWEPALIDHMTLWPIAGGVVGIVELCDNKCPDEDFPEAVRLEAFNSSQPGQIVEIPVKGITESNGGPTQLQVGSDGKVTEVLRAGGGRAALLRVTPEQVSSVDAPPYLLQLCATEDGYVGVEYAKADAPGAAADPKGMEIGGEFPARRLVAGPEIDALDPVLDLPGGARDLLGSIPSTAFACFQQGAALIGPREAYEFDGKTWVQRTSSVQSGGDIASAWATTSDGTLYTTGNVQLVRDPKGAWSLWSREEIIFPVDDQLLTSQLAPPTPVVPQTDPDE